MEIKCEDHTNVKTLQPPLTLINLQLALSAFASSIKHPPYFKQYSKGFHAALKCANLQISKFTTSMFRIWTTFNLSYVTKHEVKNLRKLSPATSIPINQLRAQIANFRHVSSDKRKP